MSGKRFWSFLTGTLEPASVVALTLVSGFSPDVGASAFCGSILISSALASTFVAPALSSAFTLPVADISTLAASSLGCAEAWSGFLPAVSDASVSSGLISADLMSAVAASAGLVSSGFSSDEVVSSRFAVPGSASGLAVSGLAVSGSAASDFTSAFGASSALTEAVSWTGGGPLPPAGAASDIVTAVLLVGISPLASAVWF